MQSIDENNKILFQIMQDNDIEETAICISQVFSKYETMSKSLKFSFDEFYRFAVHVCKKAAAQKLSIIAKNWQTGEVIGFIIAEDFTTIHAEALEDIDKKFEYVFSLLSELDENYRSIHPVRAGQVLHIFMLGVQEIYTKRYIGTTLVKENLNLAKQHNFEVAITEATGVASQHLFLNLGFTEESAIEYKSYKFKGKQIFSSINKPRNCLLMSYII